MKALIALFAIVALGAFLIADSSVRAETGGVNASQTLQFAQVSPGAALRECKAKCVGSFNSCVAGGCVGGSGKDGACTHAEAVAGCTAKHGASKDRCLAGCDQ